MRGKPIPLVAQHESWISLDPIRGCPASCVYCYLEPPGLTRKVPVASEDASEVVYQKLSEYQYLEKSQFSDVPVGRSFPIAIGNYTDMCLTSKNRQYLLSLLCEHKRCMPNTPVCIVTKAVLDYTFLEAVNDIGVTTIFFISLSFLPSKFEKGAPPTTSRLENFGRIAQFANLHAVHFWRPVMSINVPDREAAFQQIEQLKSNSASVSVITGLKFGDNLAKVFSSKEQHALQKFFIAQAKRSHLKNEILEPEVQKMIFSVAKERSYAVFLHTSCAVSFVLGQPDYNATFRKPHLESRCLTSTCPSSQRERCFNFKTSSIIPSGRLLEQVAQNLQIPSTAVTYSEEDVIVVDAVLTQEQQTFLTQSTGFPVRGKALIPTLEWVGSIHRLGENTVELGENTLKVSDMVTMTLDTTRLFDELVGKWDVHDLVTELVGEVGTLADSIMIKEGRRPSRDAEPVDLEDDIADVIFMLIRIANHYNINLGKAYKEMIDQTRDKLHSRLENRGKLNDRRPRALEYADWRNSEQ